MKVHKALPGSYFNSLLLNRYKCGNDYVGWHSDDEKLYGLTPEIASVSFGCDRDFFLKKKPCKTSNGMIKCLFTSCKVFCMCSFPSSGGSGLCTSWMLLYIVASTNCWFYLF